MRRGWHIRSSTETLIENNHVFAVAGAARSTAINAVTVPHQLSHYQRPMRLEFELTEMSSVLLPVLQELCRWGNRHLPDTWVPPANFMERKSG
jgi:hypothetical protein